MLIAWEVLDFRCEGIAIRGHLEIPEKILEKIWENLEKNAFFWKFANFVKKIHEKHCFFLANFRVFCPKFVFPKNCSKQMFEKMFKQFKKMKKRFRKFVPTTRYAHEPKLLVWDDRHARGSARRAAPGSTSHHISPHLSSFLLQVYHVLSQIFTGICRENPALACDQTISPKKQYSVQNCHSAITHITSLTHYLS